jgi:hypothetical protein
MKSRNFNPASMNGHGGKREGAGRKPGAASRANEEARRRAVASGETPLEYMLNVMRDKKVETSRRDAMALAAAPFCHAKLAPRIASLEPALKDVRKDEEAEKEREAHLQEIARRYLPPEKKFPN